ncbi:MAG: hypothetical protein AB1515_00510 [Nitrospirota bacterium]
MSERERPPDQPAANLREEVDALRKEVAALRDAVQQLHNYYTATCDQCGTRYDLLAHHYSVGLFDNVVYVKCPKCQKAVPVEGRQGEGFRLISEKR